MKTSGVCWTLFGAVGLFALAGCTESTSSKNIKTAGISATIEVVATSETSSSVTATLKVGGDESNTYVILEGGDSLTASAGGETKTMTAQSEGVYRAEFDRGEEGTEFVVSLERTDDTPAPNSRGVLPAPFSIGALEEGKSRASDPIEITWSPSGSSNDMELEVNGDCIFLYSKTIPDSGSYTIEAGELDSTGGDMPEACNLTVRLARVAGGQADPAYDPESSFKLSQVRTGTIASSQP